MSNILNFNKNDAAGEEQRIEVSQVLTIDIEEVDVSHVNPRRNRGENYNSIKESIKNIGIQSILTITKRPDSERYSLFNGGNTRLTILKELLEEYRADGNYDQAHKIQYQQCRYVPYTDDLDSLVKQMAENEERSRMTLIDKARAVFQIREMYLSQHNVETVSNNKLVQYIHHLGWTSVNQPIMTELSFAYDKLETVIPLALNAGLGRPRVNQLRVWLNYVRIYLDWLIDKHGYDFTYEQAEAIYYQTLSEFDDDLDPLDLAQFYNQFLHNLAMQLIPFDRQLNSEVIRFELLNVEELGYVPEEVPQDELFKQLRETSTTPRAVFPPPRKPRTTKPKDDTGADHSNQKTGAGNISPETGAGNIGQETATDNNEFSTTTEPVYDTIEAVTAAMQVKANAIVSELLKNYDSKQTLRRLLEYGDDDNRIHQCTPFFTLNVYNDKNRLDLIDVVATSEHGQQYCALYFIYLYQFYISNHFNLELMDDKDRLMYKNLCSIWSEFGNKFNDYMGQCRLGTVYQREAQVKELLEVDSLIQAHTQILREVEVFGRQAPSY